jgi:hypothetical protein
MDLKESGEERERGIIMLTLLEEEASTAGLEEEDGNSRAGPEILEPYVHRCRKGEDEIEGRENTR